MNNDDAQMRLRPSPSRLILLSLLFSAVIWLILSWPLPRFAATGIPASHDRVEVHDARYMIPGDHLQLLYYFWILGDMVRGHTPWFYNLYEFNDGNDAARYEPHAYYFPFSVFFTALEPLGGRAFAFNASGFIGLWLTSLFSWLLLRRYTASTWIAGGMAMLSILLPYRWFAFLGGSPTGYAMTWVPLAFLGLDYAVRDNRRWGGWLAGAAVILSFTSDIHVFFFITLFLPVWCVFAFLTRAEYTPAALRDIALNLIPAIALTLVVLWYNQTHTLDLGETHMAAGREMTEVMSFSPQPKGFWSWREYPVTSQIYIGYTIPLLLLAGFITTVWRFLRHRRKEDSLRLLQFTFLGLVLTGVAVLAVGPHGPLDGMAFKLARLLIPPYAMIRQAGKIFAIMPVLLAVGSAIALSGLLWPHIRSRRWTPVIAVAVVLVLTGEFARRTHPTISLLNTEQGAYAAVARRAAELDVHSHVLVVTLWPGDTHYASIYQYFASLYRIRMINGYTPAIRLQYLEDVFHRFQSINHGWMTDEQADNLLDRGIRFIVVHEDLFPEKVSPFPIAQTLKRFHEHARLDFLKQDGSVWAFEILNAPRQPVPWMPEWNLFFPARHYEFEHLARDRLRIGRDPEASNGAFAALREAGDLIEALDTATPPVPALHWQTRLRGPGRIRATALVDGEPVASEEWQVDREDWHWRSSPVPVATHSAVNLRLEWIDGEVDLDMTLLASGDWPDLPPGETITIPGPLFCHAGHIGPDRRSVHFRPLHDRSGFVLYGTKLPLEPGKYTAKLEIDSPADAGHVLGVLHLGIEGYPVADVTVPVIAGTPVRLDWEQPVNLPFNLVLIYHATAPMTVGNITFSRR